MDRLSRDRLKWKCRRGRLELDLVLERIIPTLGDEDVVFLNALLDLPDDDLWDIIARRSEPYDPRLTEIVALLRATTVAPSGRGA
jgi:antitoxin CptB